LASITELQAVNLIFLISGIFLYVAIVLDLVKTTFTSTGGGKLTKILSSSIWQLFFLISGKNGRSKVLPYAGPLVMLTVLGVWIIGLWVGFFLLILSDPNSIMNSSTKEPADVFEKLYYAAFTLSSLGVGDFTATNDLWRVLTGVAAFSGLAFITASITYFMPVLSAVGQQSKLCLYLHSMGTTPQKILINSWNGTDFSHFLNKAPELCQMLLEHSLNHHAYPVIHYFHSTRPELAVAPSVVLLNETLQLLHTAVSEKTISDCLALTMLQSALDQYLKVVKDNFMKVDAGEQEMPRPDLNALIQRGIPLREGNTTDTHILKPFLQQRKLLTNLLVKDGWSWQDVYEK
jgi:hypothetical protein